MGSVTIRRRLARKILHFFHADMAAAINHAKQPQQPQLAQAADEANIEQPIVHARLMRQPHPIPVLRTVARGDQEARLVQASLPCTVYFHRNRNARRAKASQYL